MLFGEDELAPIDHGKKRTKLQELERLVKICEDIREVLKAIDWMREGQEKRLDVVQRRIQKMMAGV